MLLSLYCNKLCFDQFVSSHITNYQIQLGVNEKGSFVLSVKNPKTPSPGNTGLDNPAQYPEDLQKKFRELRWMPVEPALLEYENTQVLFIGEGFGNFGHSLDEMSKDEKNDKKEKPEDEIEQLLDEEHDRVDKLKEDDPVFADLGLSSKEYQKMKTTW